MALGVSTLHAQYAPGLSSIERAKPWTVSAALRGFYNDNWLTLPNGLARDSFGLDFSPSFSINHSTESTLVSGSYVYDLKHYDDQGHNDQSHQLNLKLDHAFSERYKIALSDSFVVGQEPEVLTPTVASTPLRLNGNNIHNAGVIDFLAELTQKLGVEFNYANDYYSYDNKSFSATLDRIEQSVGPDLRWKFSPKTTGILGYRFGYNDYTGADASSIRNFRSHAVTVGVDHQFSEKLTGSVRVGPKFYDYYNADKDTTNPYADASLNYTYLPGSWVQVGVRHDANATDVLGIGTLAGNPVLDQQSTTPYASVTHKITPKLTGGAMVQYQISEFNGGSLNGSSEDYLTLSVNLSYQFTPYISAETGYNFNNLSTDVADRGYHQNIGYLGVRVTY